MSRNNYTKQIAPEAIHLLPKLRKYDWFHTNKHLVPTPQSAQNLFQQKYTKTCFCYHQHISWKHKLSIVFLQDFWALPTEVQSITTTRPHKDYESSDSTLSSDQFSGSLISLTFSLGYLLLFPSSFVIICSFRSS